VTVATRAYYKTVVRVEILSEDAPIEFDNLADLNYEITEGDHSGNWTVESKPISRRTLINLCRKHGTDPGFFLELESDKI
jgi:hypothetical protein